MNTPPNREVALFSGALELPASERAAYLQEACADDPALRLRLEALLRVYQDAITFLENKASKEPESPIGHEVTDATMRIPIGPSEKAGDRHRFWHRQGHHRPAPDRQNRLYRLRVVHWHAGLHESRAGHDDPPGY